MFTLALDQHPDEARRCELLLALADAQTRAGELVCAKDVLLAAAEGAKALGDPQRLARAALGFGDIFLRFTIPHAEAVEPVVGLLEEALARLDGGDSPLRARLLGQLAMTLTLPQYWKPDTERWKPDVEQRHARRERGLGLGRQAVDMARRLGDTEALASVLDTRCFALGPDALQERLDLAAQLLRLAEEAGDEQMAQQARMWRIVGFLQLGNVLAADVELVRYVRVAEALRQPVHLYWSHIWQATRALMGGRFDEAERHNLQALDVNLRLRGLDATQLQAGVAGQLFTLRGEQGRLGALEETVKGFVREFPQFLAWRAALALIHAAAGDEEAARGEFEQVAAEDFTRIPRDEVWMATVTAAAEVCVWLGDARRAVMLYELLLPFASHCVVLGRGYVCSGSVAYFLGRLAVTMGRVEAACGHFEVALAVNERIGATPSLARTQYSYARALLARGLPGDREKADALRGRSLQTAHTLGMTLLIRQLSPEPTPGTPATTTSTRPHPRTPTAML